MGEGKIRCCPDILLQSMNDNLPTIPGKISIARELIDWFVEIKSKEKDHCVSIKERN